ncbi:MAG: 2-(1,2-epoxy-1,2-dihydrophenyl)acetyl-CoA isomerase [Bacteroidetes bacterium]|nr:MAG: 2-(1,2-epoxy-1,2-dihydrophenyl)acetyl-CoA isomerase [Bacteroidota bacterium]
MSDSILFQIKEKTAVITLNRPKVFNSFNREMALALQARLDECAQNPGIRAVLLTGAGKAFCAGQDLAEAIAEDGPGLETILREHYNPIIHRIRHLEKPVIGAVNGVAAGAGANIAIACDVTVAAQSASFIQAFSKIGLVPDSGGTFFLPRLIGWQRASALMMLGEKVSATDAANMGMIFRAFPDETFADQALELAHRLSNMPTQGLALTKKALNESLTNGLSEQLTVELELQVKAGQTHDYREGVQAFLEKRKPVFKGA